MTSRDIRPFRLPLRTRFRGLIERRGCLVEGEHGWGEFAPFDDYDRLADARWLACALEQADGRWPRAVRRVVEVNAIIPAVPAAQAAAMAVAAGCRTVKVKVGDAGDQARVAAVREAVPEARIRLDVNGGWTLEQALERLSVLRHYGLEYVEQPVRAFEDMARLRSAVDVPLAADELLRIDRRFDDVAAVADVAVLKVAPLGGVIATLDAARRTGLPVVVSSALDTSLGLCAGLAAACALPQEPLACGLGTGALFAADTTDPLLPRDGSMTLTAPRQPRDDLPYEPEDLAYWRARVAAAQAAEP